MRRTLVLMGVAMTLFGCHILSGLDDLAAIDEGGQGGTASANAVTTSANAGGQAAGSGGMTSTGGGMTSTGSEGGGNPCWDEWKSAGDIVDGTMFENADAQIMLEAFFPTGDIIDVSETLGGDENCGDSLNRGFLPSVWCGGGDWKDSCQECKEADPGFSCWAVAIGALEGLESHIKQVYKDAFTSCGCL